MLARLRGAEMTYSKKLDTLALSACLVLISSSVSAELVALHDSEMSKATGEGLGFAIQDFIIDASDSAELQVTGIKDSNGGEIDIDWTDFYIMGEGSEKGSERTTGNIGSYLNPWVIRSVRGSRGLTVGDADYNERYMSVGNDVALLEFATDFYENPVQDSAVFGEFTRYLGCTYGASGCTDLGFDGAGDSFAEREVQAEINQLESQRIAIFDKYSSFENQVSSLEATRDQVYIDNIRPIEVSLAAEQEEVKVATGASKIEFDEVFVQIEADTDSDQEYSDALASLGLEFLKIPEVCSRNLSGAYDCSDNEVSAAVTDKIEDYARSVDEVNDQKEDVREEKKRLYAEMSDDSLTGYNQSYLTLRDDLDEQKKLCGYDDNLASCSDGLIARKESTRDNVEAIALSLSNNQARRAGLDIGVEFEFKLNLAEGGTRDDFLDIDMRGVFIDGTSFKLWSRPSSDPSAPGSELLGELRLNLFAKEIDIRACDSMDCNTDELREANTLNMDNFILSLNLGYGDVQPVKFSATSEGHFQLKLEDPDWSNEFANPDGLSAQDFYEDYYENAPKSYLHIGDVRVGNTSLGSSTISGARAQYLSVTTRDL